MVYVIWMAWYFLHVPASLTGPITWTCEGIEKAEAWGPVYRTFLHAAAAGEK